MAKAVKLSDIAKIVGVSTVTVSKALSGQKGVSEEVREKIRGLADEMGYKQPSSIHRAVSHKSYNIGVLIAKKYLGKYDSFYWQMYQEVTTHAVNKGCFTILEVLEGKDEEEMHLPKMIQEQKVDALIVVGSISDQYLDMLHETGRLPILYLDYYNNEENCDAVISNSYFGTYELTNYLFRMGHTKIAYVGTLLATKSITDRYFGYCKAMLEHGENVRKEWVIDDREKGSGVIDPGDMIQLPSQMPTAFVCNCDLTAFYLIKKLQQNGYRVPEDVSVVGFDNYLFPSLDGIRITTYEVDIREMARRAVHNMIQKIEDPGYKPGVFISQGRLVNKDSVKHV